MSQAPQEPTKPIRVRFNSKTNRDGMNELDHRGTPVDNIPYRELVFLPRYGAALRQVDRYDAALGQVDRYDGHEQPGRTNLYTWSPVVSGPHFGISTGLDNYSVTITDLGSMNGTFVAPNAPRFDKPIGTHSSVWTKLRAHEPIVVRSGATIQAGEAKISRDGKSVFYAPQWEIIIEPVDEQVEARVRAAAAREPEREWVPKEKVAKSSSTTPIPQRPQ